MSCGRRQLIAVLPCGALIGIVLDPSPLLPAAQVLAWEADGLGVRSQTGARRAAAKLGASMLLEVVYRPARESQSGRLRRYGAALYCRLLAS